jgi:uncharacterized cupin superfamily protein
MEWFESLMGFVETEYARTQRQLSVEGEFLQSTVNGRRFRCGALELVSLAALRERAATAPVGLPTRVQIVQGEARALHRDPRNAGALFQVASQFNLLEMIGPARRPEDGVGCYSFDRTQGPACAIAAGAATIYRNYLVPIDGHAGQTETRQLNGLADVGAFLSRVLNRPVDALWRMQNGYALASADGLAAIDDWLRSASLTDRDALRARLRIGVHRHVEVTDVPSGHGPIVSQAFCSALPVAYSDLPAARWQRFARLILEAAYEATLWEAVVNRQRGGSGQVLLTLLGGGAFGNPEAWIVDAIERAIAAVADQGLDVTIVCYRAPSALVQGLARGECTRVGSCRADGRVAVIHPEDPAMTTETSSNALLPLSALFAAEVNGTLESWGQRAGADQGDPQTAGKILYEANGITAGVWECTPGGWNTVDRHATEAMLFLSGRARLTTVGSEPVIFQAGDTFVLPKGWNGRWEVLETVRKFFVEVK